MQRCIFWPSANSGQCFQPRFEIADVSAIYNKKDLKFLDITLKELHIN
jgi:hypothetical protein